MSDFDLDKLLEPFAEMARANTSPATTEAAESVPPAAVPLPVADTQAESPAPAPDADATPAAETTALPQAPATVPLPRPAQPPTAAPPSAPTAPSPVNAASHESSTEVFADLIDELSQSESPLDIEMPE